ncbi:GntR family transcriptional regulator [Nocardioides sp.]|uniref:GntR family transcriptional regulator n=1 Tax=Nocardioides sp. TaxID=35761 RepID=UPI003511D05E
MTLRPPDPASDVAPFEQLRAQIAARVAAGELPAGTRLPAVRALAADLGLAAGTVARAYKELEADGVVETRGRHGTVVRAPQDGPGVEAIADDVASLVAHARRAGLTLPQTQAALEQAWGR